MSHALTISLPTLPGALGNLDAYISSVNRIPLLSAEEELSLGQRLKQNNDLEAARMLVLSHLRLVVSIARQYQGYGLPQGDLIQEGNVGLMKAVKRFDPERGVRLVSFAMHWIKAEIHEYILRNWRLVKVATTKAQRKLFFNLRSLKQQLKQHAEDDASALSEHETLHVAKTLNVKPEEVLEMETRLSGHDMTLDVSNDDGEETFTPIAYLAAPNAEPTQQLELRQQDKLASTGLQSALETLDTRSRRIVEARWLAADDSAAATLHDLAAEFGVSAERIRQIEVRALQKMKTALTVYQ